MSIEATARPSLDELVERMNQLLRERNDIDAALDPLRHAWQRESLRYAASLTRTAHPHAAYITYFHEDDVLKFSGVLSASYETILLDTDEPFPVLDTDTPIGDLYADTTNGRWDPRFLDLDKILTAPPTAH